MAIAGMYDLFNEKWCKQTVWIVSDTHFGDKEVRAGIPSRPSDDELVKIINSKVGKNDTLIHLGDVGDINYVKQLKGYKVLICGNHDAGATNYKRDVKQFNFDKADYSREEVENIMRAKYPDYRLTVYDGYTFVNGQGMSQLWSVVADNQLFDEVYTGPLMVGEKLFLSHEPVSIPFAFNIHGHDHNGWYGGDNWPLFNACLDANNYELVNLNQLTKSGILSKVDSIHRQTIDEAISRKKKRNEKGKSKWSKKQ